MRLTHYNSCLYVDSPMPGSIAQFEPFFASGFFDANNTQIITRKQIKGRGPDFRKAPHLTNITTYRENRLPHLPLDGKNTIFYTFNSKSNVTMTSNRRVSHTLILHGESNKVSSCRPIARIYDYVCVPGLASIDRYVEAGIFRRKDAIEGRLIMTGDTFIQSIGSIRRATSEDYSPWILYAPTWENTSSPENYSSAVDGYGFDATIHTAKTLDCKNIVIKLHPNYGKKDKSLITSLISSIKKMISQGLKIRLLEPNLDAYTRLVITLKFGRNIFEDIPNLIPVRLALVDISGMEAICLKQDIPHIVITKPNSALSAPRTIAEDLYPYKTIVMGADKADVTTSINRYLNNRIIDSAHKSILFSYSINGFERLTPGDRHTALLTHITESGYWNNK